MTVTGHDGLERCPWGSDPGLARYHDEEWGRELRGDRAMFERLSLEAFQSGLSWSLILRKREAFRAAFVGFVPALVSRFDESDVERLMTDAGIVRNRAKIESTISNARATLELGESLSDLVWSFAPDSHPAPRTVDDVPATSAESTALAKALKQRGFKFVGPTTAYALMQATGMVDDHLVGCVARRS
ncbi:DNA-3-methyladenine glycosylase I [Aeromicrobium sp. Leaf291]|uniref:DNA-3-methyladenine glycosylase I n=1 Tax=Aeromicrobium sp. Leaf291 TaxID=1736325 RepID=UPI0006FC8FA8|nr:DNA-3-methyladenine glycosylase I [Aeromicrobium sp. Leaf291]KQP81159.1 3-methyladenine DNA glycosylase [Aeromicrobium sp. Leaf291]